MKKIYVNIMFAMSVLAGVGVLSVNVQAYSVFSQDELFGAGPCGVKGSGGCSGSLPACNANNVNSREYECENKSVSVCEAKKVSTRCYAQISVGCKGGWATCIEYSQGSGKNKVKSYKWSKEAKTTNSGTCGSYGTFSYTKEDEECKKQME